MKKKIFVREFIVMLLAYMFAYGTMYIRHYATDSYYAIMNATSYGRGNLALGRYGCELVYYLARLCRVDYDRAFYLFVSIMIVSFALFTAMISHHIIRVTQTTNAKKQWMIRGALILVLANSFAQEWFTFWECALQWAFSLLFLGLAIVQIGEKFTIKRWIASIVLLTLSLGFYQASVAIFLIVSCTIIYMIHEGVLDKNALVQSILVIIIGGISSVLNLISIKVFQFLGLTHQTVRTGEMTVDVILNNVKALAKSSGTVFLDNCGIFPRYLFVVCMLVLLVYIVYRIMSLRQAVGSRIVYLFLMLVGAICSIYIPHLFTTSLFLAQRTLVGFWTIGTMIILVSTSYARNNSKGNVLICGIECVLLITHLFVIQSLTIELINCNRIDEERSYAIQQEIMNYQNETGNTIDMIGIMKDSDVSRRYKISKYEYGDTCVSAFCVDWSDINAINYYNKTTYQKIDVDEKIYKKYAEDKNWDSFNPNEQMIFDGNCLYIIIY